MHFCKKILAPILLLALVFTLAACGEAAKSPYDLARENGYTGSVSDWLADLKGEDLDIEEIYDAAVRNGYTGDFLSFLSEFLSFEEEEVKNDGEPSGISHALLSSVSITSTFSYRTEGTLFPTTKKSTQSGSGVIYSLDRAAGDAYIITNHHVVYYYNAMTENGISDDISVYLYGKESSQYAIPAHYVGGSMQYDIAVLRIESNTILRDSEACAVRVANSDLLTVGATAIAIGNPEGAGISVTRGIISVDSESITMKASDNVTSVTHRLMRVDTAINSGNSGGGLFSEDGRLIGIVNAKMTSSKVENIGYAIPSNVAVYVAQNIIDTCNGKDKTSVSKCLLGVTLTVSGSSAYYDDDTGVARIRESVQITNVSPGSLAAGKLKSGDVITAITINGVHHKIERSFTVIDLMLTVRVGDTVVISVLRAGTAFDVTIVPNESSVSYV